MRPLGSPCPAFKDSPALRGRCPAPLDARVPSTEWDLRMRSALRMAGPRRTLVPLTPHTFLEKLSAADVFCQDSKRCLLTLSCQYPSCFRLLWELATEGPFPDRWPSQRWGGLGCWGDVLARGHQGPKSPGRDRGEEPFWPRFLAAPGEA